MLCKSSLNIIILVILLSLVHISALKARAIQRYFSERHLLVNTDIRYIKMLLYNTISSCNTLCENYAFVCLQNDNWYKKYNIYGQLDLGFILIF